MIGRAKWFDVWSGSKARGGIVGVGVVETVVKRKDRSSRARWWQGGENVMIGVVVMVKSELCCRAFVCGEEAKVAAVFGGARSVVVVNVGA